MSMILALLLQVGPFPSGGSSTVSPLPPEMQNRTAPRRAAPVDQPALPRPQNCLTLAETDPAAALAEADSARAGANHCRGVALAKLKRWDEAETSLIAARDAAPDADHDGKARLGALAGFAALEAGKGERALVALDQASGDADLAGERALSGEIEMDRARALVSLRRADEAASALERARSALPADGEAWLLSATLSRRIGRLADAQAQIETAARLMPAEPEVGLEAGVIAVMSGRGESARRSWQSVIAAAPSSPAAAAARGYLEQLGAP